MQESAINGSYTEQGYYLAQRKTFKSLLMGLGVIGMILLIRVDGPLFYSRFQGWWDPPPEWMPCFKGAVSERLIESIITMGPYGCSTQDRKLPAPCLCCVRGACWREIRIASNSTEMRTVVDRVDGQALRRKVPRSISVCFVPIDTYDPNCTDISDLGMVSDLLRARELLRGWGHDGEPYIVPFDEL